MVEFFLRGGRRISWLNIKDLGLWLVHSQHKYLLLLLFLNLKKKSELQRS